MARILVQADGPDSTTVFDERDVRTFHLEGESAAQLLERLAWAIEDAERRYGPRRRFTRGRRANLAERHAVRHASDGPFE